MTKDHSLVRTRNSSGHDFGEQKSKTKPLAELVPLGADGEPAPRLWLWWPPATLGIPWCGDAALPGSFVFVRPLGL